jgi:hypothetical protein
MYYVCTYVCAYMCIAYINLDCEMFVVKAQNVIIVSIVFLRHSI